MRSHSCWIFPSTSSVAQFEVFQHRHEVREPHSFHGHLRPGRANAGQSVLPAHLLCPTPCPLGLHKQRRRSRAALSHMLSGDWWVRGTPCLGIYIQPSALLVGSACCCCCAPPRPGSCGDSSTRSCGTGASTGMSRVPSGESQLPPDSLPDSLRGNQVCARTGGQVSGWVAGLWGTRGPPAPWALSRLVLQLHLAA